MKKQIIIAFGIACIMLSGCCKPKQKEQPAAAQQPQYCVTNKFDLNAIPYGTIVGGETNDGSEYGTLVVQTNDDNAMITVTVPKYVWDAVEKGDTVSNCSGAVLDTTSFE